MSFQKLVYNEVTSKYESDYPSVGTTNPFVTESGVQTLTNKTFTSPTITSPAITTPTLTSPTIVTPLGVVVALETLFTQLATNHTHTATFPIPAGATILDVIITNSVVWNSDTSATLKAGMVDDDCFYAALDLKTVPAAGKSINFAWPGNVGGASIPEIDGGTGNQQLGATNGFLYNAAAASVVVVVTDVNVAGTNGRTRVTVLYSLPSSVIAPVVT